MTPYENYLSQMKRLKASLPYMSEKDFCEAHGLQYGDKEIEVYVARRSASAKQVEPTLKAHIDIKPLKEKRAYKYAATEEEKRLARTQYTRTKREKFKVAGLTNKGKPFKSKVISEKVEDFKNIDEYHDYLEALKISKKLGINK